MTALRLIMLAMLLLVGDIVAVYGQAPSALPPGMTQDQFDAMVDAIGKALVVKLRSEGALPAPAHISLPSLVFSMKAIRADEAPLDFCYCWRSWLGFPSQRKRSCANR